MTSVPFASFLPTILPRKEYIQMAEKEEKNRTLVPVFAVINSGDDPRNKQILFVTKNKDQAHIFKNDFDKLYALVGELNQKYSVDLQLNYVGIIEIIETHAI